MTQSFKEISKFFSYVLRHKPDAIGLKLDPYVGRTLSDVLPHLFFICGRTLRPLPGRVSV